MRLATARMPAAASIPTDARAAPPHPAGSLGASYLRLGDDVLFFAADSRWKEVRERAGRADLALREHSGAPRLENLHLVVQLGTLFQQAHPDVTVILNKGRYLVVEFDEKRLEKLSEDDGYTVRPVRGTKVVFDVRPLGAERVARLPWIAALVSRVSRSNLGANLEHLVSFPTRHSTSSHYTKAAAWARGQLEALGYSVRTEKIAVDSRSSHNVIADKAGHASGTPGLVLVTAHLDSINDQRGPAAKAPGADDNGSGSAGLLEIASALRDHHGAHDLRFIVFGGEEQGLYGSRQHVARLTPAERARIRAVVNMDMIATLNTSSPTVMIEGAAVSQSVMDGLAAAGATYANLTVQTTLDYWGSDHVPFIEAGLPAVLTIEGADRGNPNPHTPNDTLDHINYDLMLAILSMNVAFIAGTLGQ